jgi:sugar lactone lactonase YvrE
MIADPEAHLPKNRFNDGKVDPAGRVWCGTMADDGATPRCGSLYCLDVDLSIRRVLDQVSVSNGIAWSGDARTMYYIDTATRAVAAFDFDVDTGHVSRRRDIIRFPDDAGLPDGMTIDRDEMLWIAHWGGWRVSRWNPQTGMMLQKIAVSASRVSSCCFGGPN